jgi:hypothetical protein
MILVSTLLILMLAEAAIGWGLRVVCWDCNFPGEFWLLIAASAIGPPLVGFCLVGMVVCLIAGIVRLIGRKPDGRALLSSAALLFFFAVGFVAAGFIPIASPITYNDSLSTNGKTYLLANANYFVDNEVILYECDSSGILCSRIFTSGELYLQCESIHSLTADPATGQVSVQVGGAGTNCARRTIYPADQ